MSDRGRRIGLVGVLLICALVARWLLVQGPHEPVPAEPARSATSRQEVAQVRAPQRPAPARTANKNVVAPVEDAGSATLLHQILAIADADAQIRASTLLARNAEEAERTINRYCERARKLEHDHLFKDVGPSSDEDAGPFLAPLVDWFTAKAPPPLYAPQRRGLLHLPETLAARIDAAGKNWPSALPLAEVAQLDFSWMTEALEYGHWSLTSAGPIAEMGRSADLSVVAPDLILLLDWAKLRYVKALLQHDLDRAAFEVRHLAYLVHTTGGTIADNVSLRMTGLLGRIPDLPQEIAAEDPRALTEADDLGRAGAAFFWPGVPVDVARRAAACSPSPCSAFLEGAFLRGTLGQLSPVETDDSFWTLGSQSCDARMIELVRNAPPRGNQAAIDLLHSMSQLPLERLFGRDVEPHVNGKLEGHHTGPRPVTHASPDARLTHST